ncbi:hypothetical protein PENTCL1PPCAC_17887, partial [Pristionchus entomophagus]
MDSELDQRKRSDKMRLLRKWLICLRDHRKEGMNDFFECSLKLEIKYRLEKMLMEYDPEIDVKKLLDELILCRRDHRPICICRKPVDMSLYHDF